MAHQDNRYSSKQSFGATTIYRDLNLLSKRLDDIRSQNKKSIVVFRGLPGSDKSHLAEALNGVELFQLTKYLDHDADDKPIYTSENVKKAHLEMRKDIVRLLRNTKNTVPIVVDAPHVYMWELKYYRVQACQYHTEFMVYECRTLFSKTTEVRMAQLAEININNMVTELIQWLTDQNNGDKLSPSQKNLLTQLTTENASTALATTKAKNNSFCPTILLNIQLAGWLTKRSTDNVYMDQVWTMLDEWEEITSDANVWKATTPAWGY